MKNDRRLFGFGLGHNGDIKEDEPRLERMKVATKPVLLSTNSNEYVPSRMTEFKEFSVVRYQASDGEFYNVAFDVMPSRNRVDEAVNRYHPRPAVRA